MNKSRPFPCLQKLLSELNIIGHRWYDLAAGGEIFPLLLHKYWPHFSTSEICVVRKHPWVITVSAQVAGGSYLMDEHVNRFVERHSLSVGHGQEPKAHADVEPFTHADAVEGLRVFLGARCLILLSFAHSCKEK